MPPYLTVILGGHADYDTNDHADNVDPLTNKRQTVTRYDKVPIEDLKDFDNLAA